MLLRDWNFLIVLGALVGLISCNGLSNSQAEESAAKPKSEASVSVNKAITKNESISNLTSKSATKSETKPSSTTAPSAEVQAPTSITVASPFDALIDRLSKLEKPSEAKETTINEDNATAWKHYKAKEYALARIYFARVAARDPSWKHAHNIACASARINEFDDVRTALEESFRRGGDTAKASAKKDSDLADIRELPWFLSLIADTKLESEKDEEDLPTPSPPANCPSGVTFEDEHYCLIDLIANWNFTELVLDKPVTLTLKVPTRPPERWRHVKGKIPLKELRAELSIQHTVTSFNISQYPNIFNSVDTPFFDYGDPEPFFWWPEDNIALLVIPHREKIGTMRINSLILARQTEAGWRATNLEVALVGKHSSLGGSAKLETGFGFRNDGLELFTLAQLTIDGHDDPAEERWLCRIRWEHGRLARACASEWKENVVTP